jgi:ArsR family transcriptional regulator
MPAFDASYRFKANILQALAHPTRIAMVDALRRKQLSAGQLIQLLGLEQANASQHLAVLRSRQIVVGRKEGNQVFYSLRNPGLVEVLEVLQRYFQQHIARAKADLNEVRKLEARSR